ncbi:MAG TPA: ABC transporter permease [Terracidiphilus sp.]|nr:ABC transporter permease [Terracidiphilus sp.]
MRFENWVYTIPLRLRSLFRRKHLGAELDEELRDHIDRQTEENVARGMDPQRARLAALRSFGNPTLERERTRATWSWSSFEQLLRELRIGLRTLRRTPGFTVVAIVVMALGVGANVALFTVVRGVLLRPLPFEDPGRLLMLYENDVVGGHPDSVVAGGIYEAWKAENNTFSSLALEQDSQTDLSASGGQLPETLNSANVSWNLFRTLGVQPALGHGFTVTDDSRSSSGTVVLSWSLWQRRFGGNSGILNRTIYLDAQPYTVIGVMPAWFQFPYSTTQLWTPVYHYVPEQLMTSLDMHMFRAIGRLRSGVTPAQATADLTVITRRIHDAHLNDPFISVGANSRPLLEHMVGDIRTPLYALFAATACLLLIACLNVANLLVARAAARRKELSIRMALGGGHMRLLREHLMESFVLSVVGGVAGLAFAYGAIVWLVHSRPGMTRVGSIHIDAAVAGFTVGVIALCALFAGLISALSASDRNVLDALRETSRANSAGGARTRLRKVLLSVEVGATVVLLVAASLLLKSYVRLRSTNLGCLTENVLSMRVNLPGASYKSPGPMPPVFFESLLQRVRTLPGVDAAGIATVVPGQGRWGDFAFSVAEHPPLAEGKGTAAINRSVDPGYFTAMGIPILSGHSFDDGQAFNHVNEVVINESFVQRYFPGEDPIGKHLRIMGGQKLYTIVGVVGDVRYSVGEPPAPMQYYSLTAPTPAGDQNFGTLVVRSKHDVEQLALPIQRIIEKMDRNVPVSDVLTMDQLIGTQTIDQSFNATLISGFAVLSLLLAAAGLFGVLSYVGAQRSGEIGIRISLGAQRGQIMRLMLSEGMRPALTGLCLGLAASAATTNLIQAMLYGTKPLDPAVFISVAGALIAVAALACIIPAWRASRLDPMQALRME